MSGLFFGRDRLDFLFTDYPSNRILRRLWRRRGLLGRARGGTSWRKWCTSTSEKSNESGASANKSVRPASRDEAEHSPGNSGEDVATNVSYTYNSDGRRGNWLAPIDRRPTRHLHQPEYRDREFERYFVDNRKKQTEFIKENSIQLLAAVLIL